MAKINKTVRISAAVCMLPDLPTKKDCGPVAFGGVPVRLRAIRSKLGRVAKTRDVFFAGRILAPDNRQCLQCLTDVGADLLDLRGGIPAPIGDGVFHNVSTVRCCVLSVKEKSA